MTDRKKKMREYRRHYREKNRKPCRLCNTSMTYPTRGRMYCEDCQVRARRIAQKKHRTNRLAKLATYKLYAGCVVCGYNKCASALHFHHEDPTKKKRRVWVPYGEEFDKCILLCANCHFELHEKKEEHGDV